MAFGSFAEMPPTWSSLKHSSDEFKLLARRLGYRERDRAKDAALLAEDIRDRMRKVHEYFVLRFDFAS